MSTRPGPLRSSQEHLNGDRFQTSPSCREDSNSPTSHPGMFSPQGLSRGPRESSSLSPTPGGHFHDANTIPFPDAPTTELPPIQSHSDKFGSASNHTLPSLSSVTGVPPPPLPPIQRRQPEPIKHWPSLNPLTAFYTPSHVQPAEPPQHMDRGLSPTSPDRSYGHRSGSVSLDDPAVRAAAEALGELRADFLSSPPNRSTPLPGISPDRQTTDPAPEPLLSLITTTVPSLAATVERGTILVENATSLYNQGKNMSPTVVKNGVEYVEGYLSPVAKVVGTVSRRTGMEGGVRWILNRRRHKASDLEPGERGGNKRRKTKLTQKEVEAIGGLSGFMDQDKDRRMSISTVDTLPAYDDLKSPAYTETLEPADQSSLGPGSNASGIPQRIIVTTSSLGVAMTDQSLRNLKFCLEKVRAANSYIAHRVDDLKSATEKYDAVTARTGDGESQASAGDRSRLMAQMNILKLEIYTALQTAIETLSAYAGNSLPQNARDFVIANLKSLPSRFPWKTMKELQEQKKGPDQEKAEREGYNVALQFAKDGLATMIAITDLLERTILSAESWLETLYKKNEDNAGSPQSTSEPAYSSKTSTAHFSAVTSPMSIADGDVHMGEVM